MFVKETIAVVRRGANAAAHVADKINQQMIFKYFAPFTDCISETNDKNLDKDVLKSRY